MKKDIHLREKCGFLYTSFFSTGKEGTPIEMIKEDPEMVRPFADNLADYVANTLGGNLKAGDWCLATTPRRRHSEGFHFATEICRAAAPEIGIPFREDIVIAHGRGRVAPEFELKEDPPECNVILYDDIMTTGMTMKETRELLIRKGHTVLSIVAMDADPDHAGPGSIDGVTQEEVFSRITSYKGTGEFGTQDAKESAAYQSHLVRCIRHKMQAFLLEYTKDNVLKLRIRAFCTEKGIAGCCVSDTVDL